jgi:HAD superfamily hydrolase (TIGR01549 family)
MLDAVTFDFWNTVVAEVTPSILDVRTRLICSFLEHAGYHRERVDVDACVRAAWSDHRREWAEGRHLHTSEVARRLTTELDTPPRLHSELTDCLEYLPPASELRVALGLTETLQQLRVRNIRIGLICDTGFSRGTAVRRLLADIGVSEYFTGMTFSDEVGAVKPDRRMFEHAMTYLAAAAAPAHVGDLRRSDVVGASRAGWVAVRYAGFNDDQTSIPDAEFVIYSHSELIAIVQGARPRATRDTLT